MVSYGLLSPPILNGFFFFLLLSFFPRLFSAVADWMSTIGYFDTWCGLSANLECRTEMCCTLAENTRRKNSPSAHHRTTFRPMSVVAKRLDGSRCHLVRRYRTALLDYIFATKACTYRQSEKNWLNSNMSSTCPHNMVNFSPLTAEIGWRVWNIHSWVHWWKNLKDRSVNGKVRGKRIMASLFRPRAEWKKPAYRPIGPIFMACREREREMS